MRKLLSAGVLALVPATLASADVFSGPGGPLADAITSFTNPGVTTFTINVGTVGTIASLNSVTLTGMSHTWVGDLMVTLQAPNGDNVHLWSRPGCTANNTFGNSNDLSGNYIINNSGSPTMTGLNPLPAGTYTRSTNGLLTGIQAPDNDDYTVFNGDAVNGNWTLTFRDWGQADIGSLGSWSIDVTLVPAPGSLALLGLAGLCGPRRRRA